MMNGNLLADEYVYHHFYLRNGKIAQFEIGEKIKNIYRHGLLSQSGFSKGRPGLYHPAAPVKNQERII